MAANKHNSKIMRLKMKDMGIPCGHSIRNITELNRKVSATHFDVYWLYNWPVPAPDPLRDVPARFGMIDLANIDPLVRDPADIPPPSPVVLPPLKVRAKGRPRKDDTSTRRLPSAWESNGGPRSSGVSLISYSILKRC